MWLMVMIVDSFPYCRMGMSLLYMEWKIGNDSNESIIYIIWNGNESTIYIYIWNGNESTVYGMGMSLLYIYIYIYMEWE